MIGAIIGDVAGSRFEWNNIKTKEFRLFHPDCRVTDDSVMSLALARAILDCGGDFNKLSEYAVARMQELGRRYPHAGFGGRFREWLGMDEPAPYNSFGNGSAMRVSPAGFAARSLEEAKELSEKVTAVTHNHPEGIKGAEATAVAIRLAQEGKDKEEIRDYIHRNYYPMDFTLEEIRPEYKFDVSCQGSVPQALKAFFESTGFEDAIRNAISIGGDSDTIAAICGSVAEAYYGVPELLALQAKNYLPDDLLEILERFEEKYPGNYTD